MEFAPEKMLARRLTLNMTQRDVAKKAYCNDSEYQAWEDGKEAPSAWWLSRLAFALECEKEDLHA